eukprot:TRINITY_DN295_c3_g3_i1.p1 TRINITY_DN295_c3_g3~~TRINITY_DN295_c3_g3_i1.p1  ORF type:complete len:104 (+),score=16.33 TRINITY_DN295_c3_g3_i1:55-366(+)
MSSKERGSICLEQTFTFHGREMHDFRVESEVHNPWDAVENKPGVYKYTGEHDHGKMTGNLKKDGSYGGILKAIDLAQADSNEFLTKCIKEGVEGPDMKIPRTE